MASIAGQERDLSWMQMVPVDHLDNVCRSVFSTFQTLTPFFQAMSDSASASTLVDDDVRHDPCLISRVQG